MENERIVQSRVAGPSRQSLRSTSEIQPSDQSPEMLHITGYVRDGVAVVVLAGELDLATAPMLARYVDTPAVRRRSRVVVDVSGLTFCDCAGLTALLRASRHCVEKGGWLRLSGPSAMLARTLRITRLGQALACYPSMEAACAAPAAHACDNRAARPGRPRGRARSLEPAGQRDLAVPAPAARTRVTVPPAHSSGS